MCGGYALRLIVTQTVRTTLGTVSIASGASCEVSVPPPEKPCGVPRIDDRRVLSGLFWVLESGAPWRALSERYGARTTFYPLGAMAKGRASAKRHTAARRVTFR